MSEPEPYELKRMVIKLRLPHPPKSKKSASTAAYDDVRNRIMESAHALGIEVPSGRSAILHVQLPHGLDMDNYIPGIFCLLDRNSNRRRGLLADDRQILELHVKKVKMTEMDATTVSIVLE